MHNLVVLIMGVCTIGLKVWNKDGCGRREYVQREMCNLKKKWATGEMKWYTVDIKNFMFQHHTGIQTGISIIGIKNRFKCRVIWKIIHIHYKRCH